MIEAKFKKIGKREESIVKIALPEAVLPLFKDYSLEILEIDNDHCIYITDKNGNDILSYTILYFKHNDNVKYGFQRIVEKLQYIKEGTV